MTESNIFELAVFMEPLPQVSHNGEETELSVHRLDFSLGGRVTSKLWPASARHQGDRVEMALVKDIDRSQEAGATVTPSSH
jgi:hypothetical protein